VCGEDASPNEDGETRETRGRDGDATETDEWTRGEMRGRRWMCA